MDSPHDDGNEYIDDDFVMENDIDTSHEKNPTHDINTISPSKRQAAIDQHHRHVLVVKENQLRQLENKINSYRKANTALKKELESFHSNDVLAQLENKTRMKQLEIEKLSNENKYLVNLQRTQAKRIEELESIKDHFPTKHHSIMEELRICKETYRMYKEKEKQTEERSIKLHQQVVDLTSKNKILVEKISLLEQTKGLSNEETISIDPSIELQSLHSKVTSLEKAKRIEKIKYERIIITCQEQLNECKREMEIFQNQLMEKEKELRIQVVELKKFKRQLRELAVDTYTNHQMESFLVQRGVETKRVPMPPPPSEKRLARIHKKDQVERNST